MTLTKEQLEALAPYEPYFETAIRSRWSRYPGTEAMRLIHRIYTDATGAKVRLNTVCGACRLRLLRDTGKLYFADKAEAEAAKVKETLSSEAPAETAAPKKVKQNLTKAKKPLTKKAK